MTQEEFNAMLQVALAQGLPGGYYTSKYSGEEIDALLDKITDQQKLKRIYDFVKYIYICTK